MQYYGNIGAVFTTMVVINAILIALNRKGRLSFAIRIYGFMEIAFVIVGFSFIGFTISNANFYSMFLFILNLIATLFVAALDIFVHGRKQ